MHSYRFFYLLIAALIVATLNPPARAQGVPAAPAGVGGAAPAAGGGAAVSAGAPAAAAGGVGGASFNAGSGLSNLYGPFQPGSISMPLTPTAVPASPVTGVAGGGGMGSLIPTLLSCVAQGAELKAISDVEKAMYGLNDKDEFQPDSQLAPELHHSYGSGINSMFPGEQGCQKFINKESDIGPWGRLAFAEMKNFRNSNIFEDKVPADIEAYCPAFSSIKKENRRFFWLWFFAALAKPESSCRSNAVNPNAPNGNAIGLFQLEVPACARAGVYVSSSDLYDPYNNIRCAVAIFANEMKSRPTIFTNTSKGPTGTYWGSLRNDDYNTARGGDIAGHKRMVALLRQYPECNPTPNNTVRSPAKTE